MIGSYVGLISVAINKLTNYPHAAYGAGHLYYTYFDGTSWHNETVDNSRFEGPLTYTHLNTSIAVDSSGKVHIVYGGFVNRDDGIYGEVRYATNTSGEWEISTLESYSGATNYYYSMAPSIAIDSSDKVHISYNFKTSYPDPVKLQYATNLSGAMVLSTIDSSTSADIGYSYIAIDTKDKAYISYQTTNNNPRLATNASGSWVISSVPYAGRVAIDSSDKLHISYGSGNIYYATNASGPWTTTNVAHGNGTSSIAIDSDDKVHIAYGDGLINRYATNASGVWVDSTVASLLGSSVNIPPSIAIDSGNKAHIVFYHSSGSKADVQYATNKSGAWVRSTVDSEGQASYPSVAIDSNNKAHISYHDGANGELKYATNASGVWVVSVIDSVGAENGFFIQNSSIATDSNGKIHISYLDASHFNLKYATNESGAWVTSSVDSTGETGEYSSMAVDSNNKVHISYRDRTITALKYATNASGSWVISVIDWEGFTSSIKVDSNNKVHIAHAREWTTGISYTTNVSGSWITSVAAPQGSYPSMAIDSLNKIHIASLYTIGYTSYIQYTNNASGSWVTYRLSSNGSYPSIGIDANGIVHISFYYNQYLKYATNKSGDWVISNVDLEGSFTRGGFNQSTAIDSDNNVHIAYKGSISDLRYATLENNCDGCPPISTFPYSESFESGWGVWVPAAGGDFNWTRFKGSTPSSGTGPSGAHDGEYYLYTEASSPNYPGKWAEIEATFDFSTLTAPQLWFYYHMYGAGTGILYGDIFYGSDTRSLFGFHGQQHGSETGPWSKAVIDLTRYAGMSNVRIVFGAVTGDDYTGDIAIDRIEIFDNAVQGDYYCDDDEDSYIDSMADGSCAGYGCPPPGCLMTAGDDCDDTDPAIDVAAYWYPDNDSDGYGNPAISLQQCGQPSGYVLDNTDYDDNDANIYPGGPPVRTEGAALLYYLTLQEAYNAAADNDTIQVHATVFAENLVVDRDISVTIEGGYNESYSLITGATILNGNMTISDGTVIIQGGPFKLQ